MPYGFNAGRRNLLRVAGGGFIAAATAGCSSELPDAATQAWRSAGQPQADVRRWVLGYAVLAPHSHNLQSWLVDLRRPGEIVLSCDPTRLLPQTDPFSRQIMMSHGTFLELLDLAARQRGLRADIALFPEGEFGPDRIDARPVARVRLVPDAAVRPDPLFAQIVRRRTNREAYEPRLPEPAARQAIAASTADYPFTVGMAAGDEPQLGRPRAIARAAWRIELATPRTMLESLKVLRVGPDEIARHRDGLSVNAPLPRLLVALGLFDRGRAPAPDSFATRAQIDDFNAKLEATPAFFWLVTGDNDRRTQVNAGRAYVRAQLAATAHGLAMQPLSQALQEYPEQAQPYAQIHALLAPQGGTVQMWARLGYAPAVGPAPRRGVEAHIANS